MTELSRNLLAAAREGLDPSADVAARVRARVAASVAVAPAAPAAAAAAPVKAATLKITLALLVVGAVGGLVALTAQQQRAHAPLLSIAPTELDEPSHPIQLNALEPNVATVAPSPAPARSPVRAAPPMKIAAPVRDVVAPEPEPASLSREVELIDLAMLALRRNAPGAALDAIRVFHKETRGQGQMAEEAAAIAIEAHCRLDHDVTDALAAFDAKWPESAQREKLQTACFAR